VQAHRGIDLSGHLAWIHDNQALFMNYYFAKTDPNYEEDKDSLSPLIIPTPEKYYNLYCEFFLQTYNFPKNPHEQST
jgi:hypothetical protein